MIPISISTLTICGIEELTGHSGREVTHVLSVLDPEWPEIDTFRDFGEHVRTTLRFHDIIEPLPGKIAPEPSDVEEIVKFGRDLAESRQGRREGHLLVHCHMGISRSTAAMLTLLAQTYPDESEARLYARLREIRPQSWPNSRMIAYADEILGREGRLSAELGRHYVTQLERQPKFAEWMSQLGRGREVEMARDAGR
jgi:predicted protein tyrosine phosphatase